jgi:hypothetical protein
MDSLTLPTVKMRTFFSTLFWIFFSFLSFSQFTDALDQGDKGDKGNKGDKTMQDHKGEAESTPSSDVRQSFVSTLCVWIRADSWHSESKEEFHGCAFESKRHISSGFTSLVLLYML